MFTIVAATKLTPMRWKRDKLYGVVIGVVLWFPPVSPEAIKVDPLRGWDLKDKAGA